MMALGTIGILTQEAELDQTMIVDSCIGYKNLSRLVMLWTVCYLWSMRERFLFSLYMCWVQLLTRQPGETPVTLLII